MDKIPHVFDASKWQLIKMKTFDESRMTSPHDTLLGLVNGVAVKLERTSLDARDEGYYRPGKYELLIGEGQYARVYWGDESLQIKLSKLFFELENRLIEKLNSTLLDNRKLLGLEPTTVEDISKDTLNPR